MKMKFVPERAQFINNLIGILGTLLVSLGMILRFSENIVLKSLMMLLIVMLLIGTSYYLAFLKTLYYKIEDRVLTIGSAFWFMDVHIPVEKILYFTERITLLNHSGITGMISKRFSLGRGYIQDLGKVDMYITSSKKTIFFGTMDEHFGISPENMTGFSQLLKKHGVQEAFVYRPLSEKDLNESAEKLRQYFLLNTLMVMIYLAVPIYLYYQNRFPDYVTIHQLHASMLSYVPAKVYMDSVITYGVTGFFVNLLFLFLTRAYRKVDLIYYYRIMFIPLVLLSLMLLNLANVLIPILLS